MTPDNRPPRKRGRRRRRRGPGSAGPENGNGGQPSNPDSIGNTLDPGYHGDRGGSGAGARRRRRRSRHRGGPREGGGMPMASETPLPIDIVPGELTSVSGVLYIKPNGSGMLVQTANNFVPTPGDPLVPRSVIERLHLDPGLMLTGNA